MAEPMTDEQQAAFNDWYRENIGGAPQPGVTVAPIFIGGWDRAMRFMCAVAPDASQRKMKRLCAEAAAFVEEMRRCADIVENDALNFGGSARLHSSARIIRQRVDEFEKVLEPKDGPSLNTSPSWAERTLAEKQDLLKSIAWMAQTIHQAHHDDVGGTWEGCPRNTCTHAAELNGVRKHRP